MNRIAPRSVFPLALLGVLKAHVADPLAARPTPLSSVVPGRPCADDATAAAWCYDLRMPETTKTSDTSTGGEKDFMTRLADAGEEALQRLTELPGGQKAVTAFNDLRNRVDELAKKVRGIDALEARVAKLEKELASLKKASRKPASENPGD
jgi:hypothetical protein